MLEIDINTVLGSLGMACILIAFLLNKFKVWQSNSWEYDVSNLLGSGLMVYYAVSLSSLPFFILNLIWSIVAARSLLLFFKNK